MKLSVELIPVLTGAATFEEFEAALNETKRPFRRVLAKALGKEENLWGKKNAQDNKDFILKSATLDLSKTVKAFIEIAENRNKNLSLINFAIGFLKERVRQKINEFLASGEDEETAYDLAWEVAEDEFEEELFKSA